MNFKPCYGKDIDVLTITQKQIAALVAWPTKGTVLILFIAITNLKNE
jgi:hypothetical protein